jgi:hypothetical protein
MFDRLRSLDFWAGRIAKPTARQAKEAAMGVAGLLSEAAQKVTLTDNVSREVAKTLNRAASLWRASTQPRIALAPGSIVWASCLDRPKKTRFGQDSQVLHRDRKPSPSVVVNYRQLYANWGRSTATEFAPGERIALHVLEPKFTWPLSGRFDFVDGQAGIGRYWFRSNGFDSFSGWLIEPLRFDVHLPARFADGKSWWKRGLLAVSYSAGVILFPKGFPANAFNRNGTTPAISGGEAIFEQGIVINVGRIFER